MSQIKPLTKYVMEAYLRKFISNFDHFPKQKSKEWLESRNKVIGSSELGILCGISTFSSLNKLALKKIGGSESFQMGPIETCFYETEDSVEHFTPTRYPYLRQTHNMTWGTFFEKISEKITEIELDSPVIGTDCWIPGKLSGFNNHANSPDGFSIIRIGENYVPVILEFKAPIRRVTDKIPENYYIQVVSGIELSGLDYGLFIDFSYRLCSINDFNFTNKYYKGYHFEKDKDLFGDPEWIGMVYLFANDNEFYKVLLERIGFHPFDVCRQSFFVIQAIFNNLLYDPNLSHEIIIFRSGDDYSSAINSIYYNDHKIYAKIPFKLMRIKSYLVHKNPDLMQHFKKMIEDFMVRGKLIKENKQIRPNKVLSDSAKDLIRKRIPDEDFKLTINYEHEFNELDF